MSINIIRRLEIDVAKAIEIEEASYLATKHQIPCLVIAPELVETAFMYRVKAQGRFKIIVPVDWPKGLNFGAAKLRGLNSSAFEAEGYEILLTPDKNSNETKAEVKLILDFMKYIDERAEVRYVIGATNKTEEQTHTMCAGLEKLPTPNYIRNDVFTKIQASKINPQTSLELIDIIHSHVKAPIKISGNITNIKTIMDTGSATRFGVSLTQAKHLIKDAESYTDLSKILK